MKSYKIAENFYLNEMDINMPENIEVKVPDHQFIIIDRSGSMWGEIDNICDKIIKYVDSLTEGSTVSLGWFSGDNQYGLSVPYVLKKERDGVVNTVNSYRHALGCTNFTEILSKINANTKESNNSLFFFTDGCHNCGSFKNVINELQQLKDKLNVCLFVGCGYINRDNMIEMANTVNGAFVQLDNFKNFEQVLMEFGEGVIESIPGCIVKLPNIAENICSILGKNVVNYEKNENDEIFYKASNKKKQVIYFTTSQPEYEVVDFSKDEVSARTMSHYLIQHNKTPLALKILDRIGDKHYIKRLYNTFTNEEYAKVENDILKSIFDSRKRYKEGQVRSFMPDDNAFCVLDALDIISNDAGAIIHLNDKEFEYRKTSIAFKQEDGSKLEYPKDIKASANLLKYNENRLNVNLQVNYQADVILDKEQFIKTNAINEDLSKYGLKNKQKYPVNCIRNYSIISDAKLNTPKLIVSKLSKDSVKDLTNIITFREDGKYVLDLSTLPLINKSYLKETSAKNLAEKCWQDYQLSIELSVLRWLKNSKTTEEVKDESLETFLSENFYIKNGVYQPPVSSIEATDEYQSYEFNISFKGYSKPSVSSVIKKIQADDKLTDREKSVDIYYNKYKDNSLEELNKIYQTKNKEHKKLQTSIQHAKFAIILINRGCMDEFTSRENMSIDIQVEDKTITTNFKVVQKAIKI